MAKICLVACASLKATRKMRAKDLYMSPLFKRAKEYASKNFDRWYILSAKYGLVSPDVFIEPYNKTLNGMSKHERCKWAKDVFVKLKHCTDPDDQFTFVAGRHYREQLEPLLLQRGNKIEIPLEGMGVGKQLRWLTNQNTMTDRVKHLEEFYSLLDKLEKSLGGKRIFKECTGKMPWPNQGVYFIFEPGEFRSCDSSKPRVVRVGTHMVSSNSKATFWNRLHTHRGTENGRGNHRGSIFRLHVGEAIIRKSKGKIFVPTWGKGLSSSLDVREAELELEKKVSEYIGQMSLLWINVPDKAGPDSDRAYIEKNSISLLAGPNGSVDIPSKNWLGNFSPNDIIRRSGLWNLNYVDYRYDDRFLDVLAKYVDAVAGKVPLPKSSIAPKDWYLADKGKDSRGQMFFF